MKLCLPLFATLLLAAGCKTDGSETPAASPASEAEQPVTKGRSGKIDLPRARERRDDGDRPALPEDGRDPEARRERRDERRQERMAELDKNGDGSVSQDERDAARKERVVEIRTRLDADGDGKLTVTELAESRMARRMGDLTTVDIDKNGEISAEEMQASMDAMRAQGWNGRRGGRWRGDGSDGDAPTPPPANP